VFHEDICKKIEERFALRNMTTPEINKVQAYIPEDFTPLVNEHGTAPGFMFKDGEKCLFCLPGVPFEMEMMFELHIVKYLKENYLVREFFCKDINTYDISESKIAELMRDLKYDTGVNIAWLPQTGRVNVRVYGNNISGCEKVFNEICETLKEYIWGIDYNSPMELLHEILFKKNLTISTAESCTGGMLASLLTKMSGSSAYFKGSILSYSNEIKTELLEVPNEILQKFGAVSEETVREMLIGCRKKFKTDIVCATSGIEGPDGGSKDKPVGTVYVGVKWGEKMIIERCYFTGDREMIRFKACEKTLFLSLIKIAL
jgi:nicotinamide-nucleotide amidase